ncbi:MAG: hypothetical protein KDC90_00485 [Ignavibacteriae bacterium]|nr:hypothetical protein [Ignavibacteriota bacterium]
MSKRTNFKTMSKDDFVAYMDTNGIKYTKFNTSTVLGLGVVRIKPDHFRLGERVFELRSGQQVDANVELTDIPLDAKDENGIATNVSGHITKKQLIKLIDSRIQNMGTKGVYHPKRLKPKWDSLSDDGDRLALFEKYLANKDTSIGLRKLIAVNLCHKTLEAIVIDDLTTLKWLSSDGLLQNCINKFNKYKNGRDYLKSKGIEIDDGKKA